MLRKDKALLENLTRKYGKKYLLNELEQKCIKESAGRIAIRYANPDVWFNNTSFQELEELTGYFIYDFYLKYEDEVEAEEAFIAACEEWWNNHTPAQKRKIFNEHYINA